MLFSCCEYSESKPTTPLQPNDGVTKEPNDDVAKQSKDSGHSVGDFFRVMTRDPEYEIEDVAQSHEEERVKRDTPPRNPCVKGIKQKLIDNQKVFETVTCNEGCEEVKRVFFLKDREDPLIFTVDCKMRS